MSWSDETNIQTEAIFTTTTDFKTSAIELLKFCLAETKETAISDQLEDEESELSEAYCEGLEDAIKKIASLPTE